MSAELSEEHKIDKNVGKKSGNEKISPSANEFDEIESQLKNKQIENSALKKILNYITKDIKR